MGRSAAAEAASQPSSGTALVLASLYKTETAANDDYIKNKMGIMLKTSKERRSSVYRSAYDAGREFGNSLSLHRQVGRNSTTNQKALAS